MQRAIGDGVEGHVLGQRAHGLAADHDLDDRVEEVTGAELAGQFLGFDVDRQRRFVASIDDGGYAAFATQHPGGSLASPIARFSRQGKRFAHILGLFKYG